MTPTSDGFKAPEVLRDLEARARALRATYHPSTRGVLQHLRVDDRAGLDDLERDLAAVVERTALLVADTLPDGPDLTTALRSLLRAQDDVIRAALDGPRRPT